MPCECHSERRVLARFAGPVLPPSGGVLLAVPSIVPPLQHGVPLTATPASCAPQTPSTLLDAAAEANNCGTAGPSTGEPSR